jgi:hypothetical protein
VDLLTRGTALALIALLVGCGAADDEGMRAPMNPYHGPITVWNRSQFILEEVRVHVGRRYADAANLLTAPLAPGEAAVVRMLDYGRLTAIREKVEGGRQWAVSTASMVGAQTRFFVLIVFDDGFLETHFDDVSSLEGFPLTAPPEPDED